MIHKGMRREIDLTYNPNSALASLHVMEFRSINFLIQLYTVQTTQEIKVPPASAKLTIRNSEYAIFFLFFNQSDDLLIFHIS
ncbi:hypothetical protein D3C74_393360 [compost metagenome]